MAWSVSIISHISTPAKAFLGIPWKWIFAEVFVGTQSGTSNLLHDVLALKHLIPGTSFLSVKEGTCALALAPLLSTKLNRGSSRAWSIEW